MFGLQGYSSEEDEGSERSVKEHGAIKAPPQQPLPSHTNVTSTQPGPIIDEAPTQPIEPLLGPTLGPAIGPSAPSPPLDSNSSTTSAPQSPYTQTRRLVQSLTLPPIPNLNIPPSPPGSPRASTSAKISHFLALKSSGVHFNAKLSSSATFRNPSLLVNLMAFAGIDQEFAQYDSSLPEELKVVPVGGFPREAYKDELAKSQARITKRDEERGRDGRKIEFVPPLTKARDGATRASKGSAAERIMAGLEGAKPKSPHVSGYGGRREPETRRSRFDDGRSRKRERSRSPRR